jgi:hypothetical protein
VISTEPDALQRYNDVMQRSNALKRQSAV